MSKRARKIFAWCMLIAMIASVAQQLYHMPFIVNKG